MSFLVLSSTSDLGGPFVESFRISASTYTGGPHLLRTPPLRCDPSACVLPGWQAVSGRKPWSPLGSPRLWRKGVCLRFSRSTQELNHLLRLLSVCQFWLKWADRLKHGWMQGQHDHVHLVFLRNLAKLLSLIVEESLQFPVIPCPSLNLNVQKLEGNTKRLGGGFSGVLFSYAL